MQSSSRTACTLAAVLMLLGCEHPLQQAASDTAPVAGPVQTAAATAPSRRQLDYSINAWCTTRKGLPETDAVCDCVSNQLHIQSLSDEGARELVGVLYSVGPGSDPPLERLQGGYRDHLDRAAEICGARLP